MMGEDEEEHPSWLYLFKSFDTCYSTKDFIKAWNNYYKGYGFLTPDKIENTTKNTLLKFNSLYPGLLKNSIDEIKINKGYKLVLNVDEEEGDDEEYSKEGNLYLNNKDTGSRTFYYPNSDYAVIFYSFDDLDDDNIKYDQLEENMNDLIKVLEQKRADFGVDKSTFQGRLEYVHITLNHAGTFIEIKEN